MDDKAKCKCCGRRGHGKNPDTKARKKSCPAIEKTFFKYEDTGHFSRCCLSKKKSKEGDAEHGAVTVEESAKDNTEEAASFFGNRAQEGEWLKVLPGPSQEMKPKEWGCRVQCSHVS